MFQNILPILFSFFNNGMNSNPTNANSDNNINILNTLFQNTNTQLPFPPEIFQLMFALSNQASAKRTENNVSSTYPLEDLSGSDIALKIERYLQNSRR